jgi:two-component system phosphate regulon sensor histidine kinase PhoR
MRHLHQKIFWAYLIPLLLGIAALDFFLASYLQRLIITQKTEELRRLASVLSADLDSGMVRARDLRQVDAWCDTVGLRLQVRVSLITLDGDVLGDSEVDLSNLPAVENHASRPEIMAAHEHGFGTDSRLSRTVGIRFLYEAMLIQESEGPLCYLRLAAPMAELSGIQRNAYGFLAVGSLLAVVLALLGGYLTSRLVSRPVREMTKVARRIGGGDFAARAPDRAKDEIGTLGRVLNEMREDLRARIEELHTGRREMEAILDAMTEGVLAFDSTRRILFSNRAAGLSLGFEHGEAIGKSLLEVSRIPTLSTCAQDVLAEARELRRELSGFTPQERFWEIIGVPLRNAEGAVRGGLLVFRDVTETRRLERTRQDFVANVSHEMKTPLTAIRGYAETLLDGALDEAAHSRDFVARIRDSAERLESLIEDTLSLARIERGEAPLQLEPVIWTRLLEGITERYLPATRATGLTVTYAISPDLPPIQADVALLEQAIGNLVDNAIKYNRPAGKVDIRVEGPAGGVRLTVEDTGLGIPRDDLPRVFERFYRVDKARSREKGGTGLGLSIVKHTVERHGGRVGCESEVGKGSRFWIELPG